MPAVAAPTTVKATLKNGNLIVMIPCFAIPEKSKKGKSLIVAKTTFFEKTDVEVNGKPVSVSLMAITPL